MLIKSFNPDSGRYVVTFRIPCEQLPEDITASHVNIVGNFNNWSISETPMSVADGIGFEAQVELAPGRYEYRYLINDRRWYNDWEADGYSPNRLQNADNCILELTEVPVTEVAPPAVKAGAKKAKPKPRKKSSAKTKDDLKKLEGIGPKISSVLKDAGVTTFAQVAAMSVDELREILSGKVRIFHPDTWPEQATLAAAGKWEELNKLTDKLVGGRRA
ncbi:MAG: helix-hairpin-helix domain-containing protein [Chloroflexota bacterium]